MLGNISYFYLERVKLPLSEPCRNRCSFEDGMSHGRDVQEKILNVCFSGFQHMVQHVAKEMLRCLVPAPGLLPEVGETLIYVPSDPNL